jgi:xanthine dehydrogenase accessory factor
MVGMDTVSTEETRHHRQAGDAQRRWAEQGRPAGVVRVLERQGFGTVATGRLLAGTEDGDRAGALFEGTMDTVAPPLLSSAVSAPGTAKGHVTEVNALDAGLACAGGAQLLGHPLPAAAAAALGNALGGEPCVLASAVDGSAVLVAAGAGLKDVVGTVGGAYADEIVLARMRELARVGATATEQGDAAGVGLDVGAARPAETAVSVVGEVLAVRRGRSGGPLATAAGRIGG